MEQHFDSIDSNAQAPLVFDTEQESDVPEGCGQDVASTNNQKTIKRTEQKISLSRYESVTTGEDSQTQGADYPPAENVSGLPNDFHIPVNADVTIQNASTNPKTSTPVRQTSVAPKSDSVNCSPVHFIGTPNQSEIRTMSRDSRSVINREARLKFIDPREVTVPMLGYETMEQRSRFTVFKLHVQRGRADNWFVFRRYSDFTQLQPKELDSFYPENTKSQTAFKRQTFKLTEDLKRRNLSKDKTVSGKKRTDRDIRVSGEGRTFDCLC